MHKRHGHSSAWPPHVATLLYTLACAVLGGAVTASADRSDDGSAPFLPAPVRIEAPPPVEPPPPDVQRRGLQSWQGALSAEKQAWRAALRKPAAEHRLRPPAAQQWPSWRSGLTLRKCIWRTALRTNMPLAVTAQSLPQHQQHRPQPEPPSAAAATAAGGTGLTAHTLAATAVPAAAPSAAEVRRLAAAAGLLSCPAGSTPIGIVKMRFIGAQAANASDPAVAAAVQGCASELLALKGYEGVTSVGPPAQALALTLSGRNCTGAGAPLLAVPLPILFSQYRSLMLVLCQTQPLHACTETGLPNG